MGHRLERPALGQKVPLGTLYNAHTDTFQNMSVFSEHPCGNNVRKTIPRKSATNTSQDDSYLGRLTLLQTGHELGASLFCGLSDAGGAGRCLRESMPAYKPGAFQHYAALCHEVATVDESLVPDDQSLREYVDPAVLKGNVEATHVVVSISWGCKSVITVRGVSQLDSEVADNSTHAAVEDLKDQFRNAFYEFRSAVESLQFMQNYELCNVHPNGTELCVSAYSEVFDEEGMALRDLEEAFNLLRLIPALLQHGGKNDKKGEPTLYCLLPIQVMAGFLGLRGQEENGFRANVSAIAPIPSESIANVLQNFGNLDECHKNLLCYSEILDKHKPYVHPELIVDVHRAINAVRDGAENLQQEYTRMMLQERVEGACLKSLYRLTDNIQQHREHCYRFLETAQERVGNMAFLHQAVTDGAIYIGYNGIGIERILLNAADSGSDAFVFLYGSRARREDPDGWNANVALLKTLLHKKSTTSNNDIIIINDCDASGQQLDQARIVRYDRQGAIVAQDMNEQMQFIAAQSLACYNPKDIERDADINKPVKRRMVKIPCPGNRCSNLDVCQWMCSVCHSHIEFGYTDDFLYCECGRAKYDAWRFKCNSPYHDQSELDSQKSRGSKSKGNRKNQSPDGYAFYKNKAQLLSMLKSLDQTDYVNILILGETGVGKSTFINSFVNYLAYDTLDEAKLSDELSWVVPCAFSIQTMDRSRPNGAIKERKVYVGARDDEKDGSTGQSATQKTTVYPVNVGDKTIRLIDTPGIGDTRGLAYDKKNMADILRTLSSYEHLHGILILLKSNNSRLTVTFNFCLQELLTHLHRSASSNMAFGFTNTRISNYSPGDTFGPLTALLNKHRDIGLALENQNTYCFDSESFRYLAAFKNDIVMENEEDFRRSWEHSRDEAVRLIDFFQSKTPHQVKSTLSMNGTRQLIAELTKPMADISRIISTNIKVLNDRHAELEDTQLSGDKLRQRLQVPKVHLRTVKLDQPRTVCRNKDCVEWQDDGTGEVKGVYKSPCHNPCYLTGIQVDRVNCPDLLQCSAFSNNHGFCIQSQCGHSWQEHLHVCYELEEYTAMVTDNEAKRLYDINASDIVLKQEALQDSENRINEYRDEHRQIQEAAARFCIFLKKHSITPYNDATLEYLDMLIDEEKQKALVSRDKTKLGDLQASHASHTELVNTLESSMVTKGAGSAQLDEAGVEALVQELYSLPHFGRTLRDVKEGVMEAYEATYRERPSRVNAPRRRAEKFGKNKKRTNDQGGPRQTPYGTPQPNRQQIGGGGGMTLGSVASGFLQMLRR